MNARNFSEYIDNPSQLYQISYQELKSLVLQYPYCQNLRYLLLQKSKMEGHNDLQRNLEMASTYSPDRTFLYNLLKDLEPKLETEDSYLMAEEVLELKDLGKLENDLELIEVEQEETEQLTELTIIKNEPIEVIPPNQEDYSEEEDDDFLENLLTDEAINL